MNIHIPLDYYLIPVGLTVVYVLVGLAMEKIFRPTPWLGVKLQTLVYWYSGFIFIVATWLMYFIFR